MSAKSLYKTDAYLLTCLTNTLVGSGEASYGVIDQLVQRDPTTKYPNINGSGIKGGIKEFCHHLKANGLTNISLKTVFGSEKNNDDTQAGSLKFFSADLLSLPVRGNKRPFINVTSPKVIDHLISTLELFKITENKLLPELQKLSKTINSGLFDDKSAFVFDNDLVGSILEDHDIVTKVINEYTPSVTICNLFGDDLAIVSDSFFGRLTNNLHLPVIARNHLENGESKNLFYEQVVPRQSRFFFIIMSPNDDPEALELNNIITNNVIQFGANATIGYGYCKMENFLKLV